MPRYRLHLLAMLSAGASLTACDKSENKHTDATASASVQTPKAKTIPDTWLKPEQIDRGRKVYEQHCLICHGPEGKGQPGDWRQRLPNGQFPPPPLNDDAHAWHHPTEVLKQRIREGSPPDMGNMPAWQGKLTEAEIGDVVIYIKSLWSPEIYRHWMEIEMRSIQK